MPSISARFLFALSVLTVTSCRSTTTATTTSKPADIEPAPQNSLRMGQGYNSIGGVAFSGDLSDCVVRQSTGTFGDSTAATLSIYVDSLSSQEEVDLAVSSSQQFGAGASEANVFSASLDYKDSRKIDSMYLSKYTYVFVHVALTYAPEVMTDFKPTPDTATYFAARPTEFFGKCGDRFISGVHKGAEVIAFLRCQVDSQDQKSSLDQSVKAQAGYKGLTASADVEGVISSVRKATHNNCVIDVAAQGGSGGYDVGSPDELIASAISYVENATPSTASPLAFETMPYSAILDLSFTTSVLSHVDLKLTSQRAFVAEQNGLIKDAMSVIASMESTGEAPQSSIDKVCATIDTASAAIAQCMKDVNVAPNCRDATSVTLPPGAIFRPSSGS